MNMFSLFELAKVVEFSKEHETLAYKQHSNITNHAWKDVGKRTALAINFSNGYLVLWHAVNYQKPVMRKVPWFPNRPILAMCYDFSATWLLCCVRDAAIILPALSLLEPSAIVNKIWPTNDSTEVNLPKIKGLVTGCCWWHTHQEESIAILATDSGMLYFVNLVTEQVRELRVGEHISHVALVHDHSHTTTTVLLTTKSSSQWRLPLERKAQVPRLFENEIVWNTKTSPVSAQFKRLYTYRSILHKTDDMLSDEIRPKQLTQFSPDIQLCVQNAKGRHLITAYNIKSHVFEVYEGDMEHAPLYEYHLPPATDDVLLTDKLLFMTSVDEAHVLTVAATQLAEASGEESQKQSVVQKFVLPADEKILSIYKHSFPTNWHEVDVSSLSDSEAALQGAIKEHTVLDGCLVLTDKTAYICRPRISPEFLFLKLLDDTGEFSDAERLAYILGLDLNLLYKLSAERTLATNEDCSLALKILERAMCPTNLEKFELLLRYGYIREAMPVLSLLLTTKGTNELTAEQRPVVAQLAVACFVHQIITSDEQNDVHRAEFRSFLFKNFYLDKLHVLQTLFHFGLSSLFIDFAQERDIFLDAIKVLLDDNPFNLHCWDTSRFPPISIPFTLEQVIKDKLRIESLLQLLDIHEFLLILEDDPSYCDKLFTFIHHSLPILREQQLLQLATIFDMSKSPWKKWCHLAMKSSVAVDSSGDEQEKNEDEPKTKSAIIQSVINMFLMVVIHLNHRRVPRTPITSLADCGYVNYTQEKTADGDPSVSNHGNTQPVEVLQCRPNVIACGENSTALVRNGDLYTWGYAKDGRLGQGALDVETDCTPHVVKSFHAYGIPILSVACGQNHCLALSGKGVYGWGSSRYGQVGTGSSGCTYITPVYIEGLDGVHVTSVNCGQYHSVALTANFKLYTWGWGVHGQLGHNTINNSPVPMCVTALDHHRVAMATAGYAHTVTLTSEGLVYTFGCGNFGQLANGSTMKSTRPLQVAALKEPIQMVSTKYFHTLALAKSGKLYCWGASPLRLRQEMSITKKKNTQQKPNAPGQNKHLKPCVVETKHVHNKIIKLSCGASFSAVLTDSGEVYTWGANSDGQLATGTNISEGKLYRVSALHEMRIVTLATGANYVVAMDTSGDLHSWGNNDKGQLGIRPRNPAVVPGQRPSKSAPAMLGRTYVRMLMGSNSVLEPSRVDSGALSRVRNLRKFKNELAVAAVADQWWLHYPSRERTSSTADSSIPALAGTGTVRYTTDSLLLTQHHLPQWVQSDRMLQICTDLQDWSTATKLALFMNKTNLALHYHLMHLKSVEPQLDADYERVITDVVHQHLARCHDNSSFSKDSQMTTDQLGLLLCQILGTWHSESFTFSSLEKFLMEFKDLLSVPFLLTLVAECDWTSKLADELCTFQDSNDTPELNNVPSLRENFSSILLLSIVHRAMDQIRGGEIKSLILEEHAGQLFPGMDKIKIAGKLTDKPKVGEEDNSCNTTERRTKSVIHVTKEELLEVTGPGNSSAVCTPFDIVTSANEIECRAISSEVVFFTCGHHCKKSTLFNSLVPELELKLTEQDPPLPRSAAMLARQYRDRVSFNMACPKCVYSSISQL